MKQFEVTLPNGLDNNKIVIRFKKSVENCGLILRSEGALKTIPGSSHWHITKPDTNGTLEATYDKNNCRFTLSYHDNRYAEWVDIAVAQLKDALEQD